MYCPRCSKKHDLPISNSYCSGCGFYLAEVIEAFEQEGKIARVIDSEFPTTRKQVFSGMALMVFGLVFMLISLVIGTPEPSLFVQFNLLVGILSSIFGVGFITYSLLPSSPKKTYLPNKSNESAPQLLKDGNEFMSAHEYVAPTNRDLKAPPLGVPNVTEETTRQLKNSDKSRAKS